ncbi:MAG: 2Fe-2S iron-sulfur cluster-binding protein, partial [Candidatus Hermodarchaeota archaeon]
MESKELGILIDFEPISRRLYVSKENSIYELLNEINIPVRSICGGLGKCGKCKILVQKGNEYLNKITKNEVNLISESEIQNGWRLACQTRIKLSNRHLKYQHGTPQVRILLPSQLLLEDFKILTSGVNKNITLQPSIQKIFLEVKKPSLEEPNADFERIEKEIFFKIKKIKKYKDIDIEFNILNEIPNLLRINKHKITIVLWNDNIIACEPDNTTGSNYGVAFDIGTTTIVGYLINLNNGKIYAVDSKLNSQTAYGEDLITRLTYIKENEENLSKLNSLVISDLNEIIANLCRDANIKTNNLYEATVVGNSIMHHIFLGLNPVNIGLSPFIPVVQRDLNVKASELGLKIYKNANVYAAPIVAGFVGADTIGVILSSQIFNEKPLTLAIDIG